VSCAAIRLIDETRQALQPLVVRVPLAVVVPDEARCRRRETVTSLKLRQRLLIALGQDVVVEPHFRPRVVRKVRQDVIRPEVDLLVRDVLRMDEENVVDRLHHRDDDGAGEAIEVSASDQTHRIRTPSECFTSVMQH
jgi:hypothetical protein